MPRRPKLRVMVASTVYNFEDQISQVCAVLKGYGYEVWNSHIGTIPQNPAKSNKDICIDAATNCDLFLGIVRPFYGSGIIGERSITHEEFRAGLARPKPRWALVHRDVVLARQLLKPYMWKKDGSRTKFKLKKNPVLDDLRVIELYNDAIQSEVPVEDRRGHWVQEFYRLPEALKYLKNQFADTKRVRKICEEMTS